MNALLWTLLALLLPKPIGFIAYFLLRRPLPLPCPNCQNPVAADFALLQQEVRLRTGADLHPLRKGHSPRFLCCPYCGKNVGAAALQT